MSMRRAILQPIEVEMEILLVPCAGTIVGGCIFLKQNGSIGVFGDWVRPTTMVYDETQIRSVSCNVLLVQLLIQSYRHVGPSVAMEG